jgi:hypothetical protein
VSWAGILNSLRIPIFRIIFGVSLRYALRKGVALPLIGITASVAPEVRIEALEPYITDEFDPSILFHPSLHLLLSEMDDWPEPQTGHHYDGLVALELLWNLAVSRGGRIADFTSVTDYLRELRATGSDDANSFERGAY